MKSTVELAFRAVDIFKRRPSAFEGFVLALGLLVFLMNGLMMWSQGARLETVAAVDLPQCGKQSTVGKPQWVLNEGHAGRITRIVANRDASILLTSGEDNSARVWNVKQASLVHALIGETQDEEFTDYHLSATFLDATGTVLAGNRVGLQVWTPGQAFDCFSEALKGRWIDHQESDGAGTAIITTRLASGPLYSPTVFVRSAGSSTFVRADFPVPTLIMAATVAPGGRIFAIGGGPEPSEKPGPGEISVWDRQSSAVIWRQPVADGAPLSLQFSSDGQRILMLSKTGLFELTISSRSVRQVLSGEFEQAVVSHSGQVLTLRQEGNTALVELHDLTTHQAREIARPPSGETGQMATAIALSGNGDELALAFSDGAVGVWTIASGNFREFWKAPRNGIEGDVLISRNANALAIRDSAHVSHVDLEKGIQRVLYDIPEYTGSSIPYDVGIMGEDWRFGTTSSISPDGGLVGSGVYWDGRIPIFDTRTRQKVRDIPISRRGPFSLAFAEAGGLLLERFWEGMDNDNIRFENVRPGQTSPLSGALPGMERLSQVLFMRPLSTGDGVLAGLYDGSVRFYSRARGSVVIPRVNQDDFVFGLDVDPGGRTAAVGYRSARGNRVDLVDLNGAGRRTIRLTGEVGVRPALRLFSSGAYVVVGGVSSVKVFSTTTLQTEGAFSTPGLLEDLQVSPDNRLIAIKLKGLITLYDVSNPSKPRELVTYTNLRGGVPFVSTPEGLFTTSNLETNKAFSWLMPDAPLAPLPPEIFMRDYLQPQLMSRLMACESARPIRPDACESAFPAIGPLAELNRIQPFVTIKGDAIREGASVDEVLVEVAVAGREDRTQPNGKTKTAAYDLRLFRDGQLVGQWPPPISGSENLEDRSAWRRNSEITQAPPPFRVSLATEDLSKPVTFSAYAFNEDRVKSETVVANYQPPKRIPKRKARAYVVTVGINGYENGRNLQFAVKDAQEMSRALATIRDYEVVSVTLISEEAKVAGAVNQATKDNIRGVLEVLAGKGTNRGGLTKITNAEKLNKATPDDLVILSFSGHGHTERDGAFYLMPSDSGAEDVGTKERLKKFISSDELSEWMRGMDAGQMAMIIDACHSAASVDAGGFKPGPMGDRGLGQLAYDRGMRILAASQADDIALEVGSLRQGLLTFALVQEGFSRSGQRKFAADDNADGTLTLAEWLNYGEQRVPLLYEDARTGRVRLVSRDSAVNPEFIDGVSKRAQTPSLFDFLKSKDPVVLR